MKGYFSDTSAYRKKPKPIPDKDIKVVPVPNYSAQELSNQRPWKWNKVPQITSSDWKSIQKKEAEQIRKAKEDIIKYQQAYINSELYSKRAKPFKDPKLSAQSALMALQNLQVEYDKLGTETNAPLNKISLKSDVSPSTIAHELGHILGARPGKQGIAQKLTLAEQDEIQRRNIQLKKQSIKSGIPYNQIEINRYNEHEISPYENKADIEALRYLMYKKGITKSYGENIDKEKLKKALEDKELKNDYFIKRLMYNFKEEDIIQLNIILAANLQQNQYIA